jgi:hypothetical protein
LFSVTTTLRSVYEYVEVRAKSINWQLLLLLILVLNVKMIVKVLAIVVVVVLNRKMLFQYTTRPPRFIWFYVSLCTIAIINLFVHFDSLSVNYIITASAGILFWILCGVTSFIIYRFVTSTTNEKLHNTVTLFFLLNAAVTIIQLLIVIADSGAINPYTYQGLYQKYFINTGDRMTGLSFDISTTNAILNAFAVVYFIYSGKHAFTLLCMVILLLTTSNFTNVLLILALVFIFIFKSTKNQKSIIAVCLCLMALFMVKISPQNNRYTNEVYEKISGNKKTKPAAKDNVPVTSKPDSLLTADERKQKIALLFIDSLKAAIAERRRTKVSEASAIKPLIPEPDIHSAPFQRRKDSTNSQRQLMAFALRQFPEFNSEKLLWTEQRVPGKLIAVEQTLQYWENRPSTILAGCGIGNFSSKLCFRVSGLQVNGGYPKRLTYIADDFLHNHLKLYLAYFSKDVKAHSILNTPNSVYDQLAAEYGLAGILCFLLLYIGFFARDFKRLTYGLPILLIMLAAFGVEYWFEQLSIVILFELLMLLNSKEIQRKNE